MQKKWPILLALTVLGTSSWAAFYAYAANQERLSSSVYKQILKTIKEHPELQAAIGDAIRPEPTWWLNGDPWISGGVRLVSVLNFARSTCRSVLSYGNNNLNIDSIMGFVDPFIAG